MQITNQQLDKFIEIYKQEFGIDIDRKFALEKGGRLVRLIQRTYLPELNRINLNYEEFEKKS